MSPTGILYLVLLLIGCNVMLSLLADRLKVPPAITLVIGGMLLALVPGLPPFELDPTLILVLFVPPILFYSAYFTVWSDFRAELHAIGTLSLGAVLFTTAAVGVTAHWVIPSLPWSACFALGAIVSPPDAVSARAVFERLNIPRRIQTILEGESLVNDASGLLLYRFAVAAALSGAFNVMQASLSLMWLTLGGVSIGMAVGGVVTFVLRQLRDSRHIFVTTVLAAYGSYIGAEAAGASGVLGVVACGLLIGWRQHEVLSAEARSNSHATWDLVVFVLEALVFVFIGLSLHDILLRMGDRTHLWAQAMPLALVSTLTVVISRFLWIFTASAIRRVAVSDSNDRDSLQSRAVLTVMSWAGMRGVVSLAAGLALPLRFPGRDVILFATFVVILVTVLIQGLTLAPLVKRLTLPVMDTHPEAAPTLSFEDTRVQVNAAAVRTIEAMPNDGEDAHPHPQLLEEYRNRMRATERLRDEDGAIGDESHAHFAAALAATRESRAELLRLLHAGEIHESVAHQIEAELDLEEIRWLKLAEAIPGSNAGQKLSADHESENADGAQGPRQSV